MPLQPPSFGSQQYWDARFMSNSHPFEWLEAPTALDPYLVAALNDSAEKVPKILHIGCGTSLLSYHLRAHVDNPELIHNLDYSEVAIRVGKKREVEIFDADETQNEGTNANTTKGHPEWRPNNERHPVEASANKDDTNGEANATLSEDSRVATATAKKYMRWSSANLLAHSSLLEACKPCTYSVIVDKSTSDSIACSEDVFVPLPYPVSTIKAPATSSQLSESPEPIHPLHILAIHLALVAKPGARWISLSYSEDRYPFLHQALAHDVGSRVSLEPTPISDATAPDEDDFDDGLDDDLDDIPQEVIDSGLPDPSTLWKLEAKYEIEVPDTAPGAGAVHRPKVLHWVYVLQRTDVEVFVREP